MKSFIVDGFSTTGIPQYCTCSSAIVMNMWYCSIVEAGNDMISTSSTNEPLLEFVVSVMCL